MENNNRQGCRWAEAIDEIKKRSERIKSNQWYPAYGLNSQAKALDETVVYLESLSPIEPCATSSETEFKEKVMEIMKDNIHFAPQVEGYVVHGAIDKIWKLHSASPTGDRDCEELKKEVERLKGLIGIDWKEEYDQAVNEIGQLQDQLKEAEDEIRELNRNL